MDATHPYAAVVSENVAAACKKAGVEYLRLIRESSTSETEDAVLVDSVDEAVNFLKETEGNILATTGSPKELFKYTVIPNYESRVFARVLSTAEVASACEKLGFVGRNLICMQGPFSEALNEAMLKQFDCRYLVTKETGKAGGYDGKGRGGKACRSKTGAGGRPPEQKGFSYDRVVEMLNVRFGLEPEQKEAAGSHVPGALEKSGRRVRCPSSGDSYWHRYGHCRRNDGGSSRRDPESRSAYRSQTDAGRCTDEGRRSGLL